MRALIYNHRNGGGVISPDLITDITEALAETNVLIGKYAISAFRENFLSNLKKRGWSDELTLDTRSHMSITSEKNQVGLCLQTGNVGRSYADMLKLQLIFVNGKMNAGVLVVPTRDCAKEFDLVNSATFERLKREIEIFTQVITMPVLVVGFYS